VLHSDCTPGSLTIQPLELSLCAHRFRTDTLDLVQHCHVLDERPLVAKGAMMWCMRLVMKGV